MMSRATADFWACFAKFPPRVQQTARSTYAMWSADQRHPSLHCKPVPTASEDVWSVRFGIHWRALGVREGGTMIWFWIGSHADYDRLIG
jgi:hypothetical protein